MSSPLPGDACTYWQRVEIREINEHGFGFTPTLSEEECEERHLAEEAADAKDPPCGHCTACVASDVEDDGFSHAMSLDLCLVCRQPAHASETDELGRCASCAAKAGQPHAEIS